LLLRAARRLEPLHAAQARETHLEALLAAICAGDLHVTAGIREAAEAARAAASAPDRPVRSTCCSTPWRFGLPTAT